MFIVTYCTNGHHRNASRNFGIYCKKSGRYIILVIHTYQKNYQYQQANVMLKRAQVWDFDVLDFNDFFIMKSHR